MRRNAYIVLLVAAIAWAVAAIALGSPSLRLLGTSRAATKRTASAIAPSCLPATIEHTASLSGTDIDVSPEPGTGTANPHTQISFLGTSATNIRQVAVTGSRSGAHGGRVHAYYQGDGASFVPNTPFDPGEHVLVRALIGAGAGARRVSFSFAVDTPYPTADVPDFANPQAAPADYQSFDTLPGAQVPTLSVTVPDHDPGAGDVLTTNGPGPGQYGPLIYTPQGQLVWFEHLGHGETAEDLSEQEYEGQRDLTWWRGRVLSLGFGQGEDLVMSSSYQTLARVTGGNGLHADLHDFQILPHDVAFVTAFNPIRCNLSSAEGSRDGAIIDTAIQEIDMKTGLVRWEWHSLDHVAVSEAETSPNGSSPWDWFHLNSIDVEGGDSNRYGDLLISARGTWAAYQLEGGSGRILWRLGGTRSSFKMGPGTRTAWQHDARMLPDGQITLFDDGANPPIHSQSRAIRIALDFDTHEARLVSSYTHPDPPLLSASQGNMQTLADGNTVVDYGGTPQISEYGSNGELLFDASLPYDMSSYRGYRFPWSGRPLSPPALLANLNNTGEETIVHMSWNGATGVSAWRVLAGPHAGSLSVHATVAASGFESSTILPKRYDYAQVQALGADGQVLGSSRTVRVIAYDAALPGSR
jgi:Arylsulfotransferase (ASST)